MFDHQLRLFSAPLLPLEVPTSEIQLYSPSHTLPTTPTPFPCPPFTQYFNAVQLTKTYLAYAGHSNSIPIDSQVKRSDLCICGKFFEDAVMVKCEGYCQKWYHPTCLKMDKKTKKRVMKGNRRWYCGTCRNSAQAILQFLTI